ncbi:hypothetical protein [Streptomyces sp. HPF1205]|uniref:hypothetical protein n=1 Tax=Streptomyces sp. HPF1205 TaxID=2873262 RepID=UPI001CEDF7B2|nr:hypothetical protein [Streptomyces sp. HPF1205]
MSVTEEMGETREAAETRETGSAADAAEAARADRPVTATVGLLAVLRGAEPATAPVPPAVGWVAGAHRLPGAWAAG